MASSKPTCPNCYYDLQASQSRIRGPSDRIYDQFSDKNVYPSLKEEMVIKSGLSEANAQMALIAEKITGMQERLGLLVKEKMRIREIIGRYRTMLRPIHQLSPEILARIFSFSVDAPTVNLTEGFRVQPPSSLDPSKHPWALSQVCRSWCRLVLNMANLWSFVSFAFPYNEHSAALRSQCYRLDLQLKRCASRPVEIIIPTPNPFPCSIERVISLLCSHSPRWRLLRIDLQDDTFASWMSSIRGQLQSLESLQIRFSSELIEKFDCFGSAPLLNSLVCSLDEERVPQHPRFWHPRKLSLPYSQIASFCWQSATGSSSVSARRLSILHCHSLIRLLRHLKYCRLELRRETITQYGEMQSTELFTSGQLKLPLEHLVELDIRGFDAWAGAEAILLHFELTQPSLERLSIFSSGPDRTALSKLLSHPQRLTHLSISHLEMAADEFSAVLLSLESLRNLSFGARNGISDNDLLIFSSITPETNNFTIVPHLKNLSLLHIPNQTSIYSDNTLLNVLESRRRAPVEGTGASSYSQLLSITLDKGLASDWAIERVEQLRTGGLRVGLRGGPAR
ncbi:hypothetical protein AAF712_010719 [Marasmius tenuissimus]|uniref:F-box domain-containing protein n=1 Tax=Marasmius tenuissimus TaxID=585030 RepID=A0ABR2ZNR0_9AGAR